MQSVIHNNGEPTKTAFRWRMCCGEGSREQRRERNKTNGWGWRDEQRRNQCKASEPFKLQKWHALKTGHQRWAPCHALPSPPPSPLCLTYYSNKLHESQHSMRAYLGVVLNRGVGVGTGVGVALRATCKKLKSALACVKQTMPQTLTQPKRHYTVATICQWLPYSFTTSPLPLPSPFASPSLFTLTLFSNALLPCLLRFLFFFLPCCYSAFFGFLLRDRKGKVCGGEGWGDNCCLALTASLHLNSLVCNAFFDLTSCFNVAASSTWVCVRVYVCVLRRMRNVDCICVQRGVCAILITMCNKCQRHKKTSLKIEEQHLTKERGKWGWWRGVAWRSERSGRRAREWVYESFKST